MKQRILAAAFGIAVVAAALPATSASHPSRSTTLVNDAPSSMPTYTPGTPAPLPSPVGPGAPSPSPAAPGPSQSPSASPSPK